MLDKTVAMPDRRLPERRVAT